MRIELYSPPYLFAGARPVIQQVATEWHYAAAVDVQTPDAPTILWAEIIRSGVTTHAFDNAQRLVDLPITLRAAGQLTVQTPASGALAPPGWYMLFLVNQAHVPSVAAWVHLT